VETTVFATARRLLLGRRVTSPIAIRGTPLAAILALSGFAAAPRPGGSSAASHWGRAIVRRFRRRDGAGERAGTSPLMIVLSRWRIEMGFALAAVVLATAHPTRVSVAVGLPFVVLGIGLRGWARGHLTRRTQLTRSGPYALVRHPLYVGSFLLGLGFAVMSDAVVVPPLFTMVFAVLYVPKALREEAFLRDRYGSDYDAYAARVGRCVPRRPPRAAPERRSVEWFSWQRVFGHREYLTWLGTAAALTVVWAEAVGALHAVAMYALHRVPWLEPFARF
jgi:protein-S-isoprenylcysteine O-methyltransferase Ste14